MNQNAFRQLFCEQAYQSLDAFSLPRRVSYTPSPVNWQNEVIYFLIVDRFSDGSETADNLLDRSQLSAYRPSSWRWDQWAYSGAHRWQGGKLSGVSAQLDYLSELGITTLWLSPVFKQRFHVNDYHGYGIQNFLDVDPHFGDKSDLIALIDQAHERGIKVLLDVIFNHSGANFIYPDRQWTPPYVPYPQRYDFGEWLDQYGNPIDRIQTREDGVFPIELQNVEYYTRAGFGDLGAGDTADPRAEHKRTDFFSLRDFRIDQREVLTDLARCYKFWIALTDCDGFRIDTLKHISLEDARNFCGTIKEFAANIGKENFFLVGEIAGGSNFQAQYLNAVERNLNAALDIAEMKVNLKDLGRGFLHPRAYFQGFEGIEKSMGSHRNLGNKHVSILDDHDHVFGPKIRFSATSSISHQVVAPTAIQLFTLGIPCIYYGTEQALSGPEPDFWQWLPSWGYGAYADRYLREAMFGPSHPQVDAAEGLGIDELLPGFGPFGTAGYHCFDIQNPVYQRIQHMLTIRKTYPVLRLGRQYLRAISFLNFPFDIYGEGELLAWSRILDDEEALIVVNVNGNAMRGARIMVDRALNMQKQEMKIILNTAERFETVSAAYKENRTLAVKEDANGMSYIELYEVLPSEVIIVINRP